MSTITEKALLLLVLWLRERRVKIFWRRVHGQNGWRGREDLRNYGALHVLILFIWFQSQLFTFDVVMLMIALGQNATITNA